MGPELLYSVQEVFKVYEHFSTKIAIPYGLILVYPRLLVFQ